MISSVETVLFNEHGALCSDFSSNLSAWLGFEFYGRLGEGDDVSGSTTVFSPNYSLH